MALFYYYVMVVQMHNRFLVKVSAVSIVLIVSGYIWLNTMHARDFNFGPPFMIMAGGIGLFLSLVGLMVAHFTKRSKY